MNGTVSDTYIISPSSDERVPLQLTDESDLISRAQPQILSTTSWRTTRVLAVSGFGGATNIPQFRFANNWEYQDTMTWSGANTRSVSAGTSCGSWRASIRRSMSVDRFVYSNSTGGSVSAFANFLDDFGGATAPEPAVWQLDLLSQPVPAVVFLPGFVEGIDQPYAESGPAL